MSNCLNCGKEVQKTEGKRPKKFCSDTCRATFHNKNKKKEPKYVLLETHQAVLKALEAANKELIDIKSREAVESVRNVAQNASGTKVVNFNTQTKSNYSIDTTNVASKEAELERLTKAVNSCSDTPLGRKAKAHYQRQIDELKK